jgi:hypothetical protein
MITEFTVKVQIGVTPELAALLGAILHKYAPTNSTVSVPEIKAEPQTTQPAESKNNVPEVATAPTDHADAAEPKTDQAAEPEPAPAPAASEKSKEYTEVDVRAAMDRTRQRIEGEDYKTNTDSELRQKWHRPLTAWFKATATWLGAEKPSELPDSDSRQKFIESCDAVVIGSNGELTEPLPF